MVLITLFKIFSEYWLWPLVIIYLVNLFKLDLKNIIPRIFYINLFGQEIKFSEKIDEFQEETQKANDEIEIPISAEIKEDEQLKRNIEKILKTASINAELGIISLSAILEREIRFLAFSVGVLVAKDVEKLPFNKIFNLLITEGYLPKHLSESVKIFSELRNKLVHGIPLPSGNKNIFRVLDIGLQLLHVISATKNASVS